MQNRTQLDAHRSRMGSYLYNYIESSYFGEGPSTVFFINAPTIVKVSINLLFNSLWRFLSYRNQSIDLQYKSLNWSLLDKDLYHERVKLSVLKKHNLSVLN